MPKHSHKKPYSVIPQLPYCCVPATIQTILYRHGFSIGNQVEIGIELGLRYPKRFKNDFDPKGIIYIDNDSKEFGTQIEKKKYNINKYFKKHKLPFYFSKLHTFQNIKKIQTFITSNIRYDHDIIIRYLRQHPVRLHEYFGHFSLVSAVDTKKDLIHIADPTPPLHWSIQTEELIELMSPKRDGIQRGLYIVKKIKK